MDWSSEEEDSGYVERREKVCEEISKAFSHSEKISGILGYFENVQIPAQNVKNGLKHKYYLNSVNLCFRL